MSDRFVCVIYYKERKDIDVLKNGMDPLEVWRILGYHAYDEHVVPVIVNRLIANNLRRGFIAFNPTNKWVSLTVIGRQWAEGVCPKFAGVIS
jgi:hypothetical protein